ncbi:high-potential iron-sulfur protein, partial [Acinetobacter baumannii]
MHPTRRLFMFQATTACLACPAIAQTSPVDEASETAVALGYKHDTSLVDAAKFPKHQPGQHCANC